MASAAATSSASYWIWASLALLLRAILAFLPLDLGSRPEVATPITSLRRLVEGFWLKQHSMSPYSGSMYHGSPLLLPFLGPFTLHSLLFVVADFMTAMLIRAIGQKLQHACTTAMLIRAIGQELQHAYTQLMQLPNFSKFLLNFRKMAAGDIASLVFLWNPFTVLTCLGSSTSPIENLVVVLSLYGACSGLASLAAFGWVMATHLSLYPVILIVPIVLLIGYGLDTPPKKLLLQNSSGISRSDNPDLSVGTSQSETSERCFGWRSAAHFLIWACIWSICILTLCCIYLGDVGNLAEMFKKTYGFILSVEDLSPNIGVLWYFFAEVFDFFRTFFLLVFHMNILFMVLPLAIRLRHRPCFIAYVYIAISSMLKSYPSIGDASLYLALLSLFVNEVKGIRSSFFLFSGYVGVSLLSPVMHNLWIWRGTGNANFYFATGLAYACLQTVLVVESVDAMLNYDRILRKQLAAGK